MRQLDCDTSRVWRGGGGDDSVNHVYHPGPRDVSKDGVYRHRWAELDRKFFPTSAMDDNTAVLGV